MNSCCAPNVFSIFQGDAKVMNLKAVYGETGDPVDLTSCTQIVVNLPNADGSIAQLTLEDDEVAITSPAVLGKFAVTITSVESALFNVGELQSFDVTFTISGVVFTVRYVNALSVFQVA